MVVIMVDWGSLAQWASMHFDWLAYILLPIISTSVSVSVILLVRQQAIYLGQQLRNQTATIENQREKDSFAYSNEHHMSLLEFKDTINEIITAQIEIRAPVLNETQMLDIEHILNNLEMLAAKYRYLNLDIRVIDIVLGIKILGFMNSTTVKNKKQLLEKQFTNAYTHLEILIGDIKMLKRD